MSKIKLPTIELPRGNDPRSVLNAIAQIKEAIELMSGVRGKSMFLTSDDLKLLNTNFNAYKSSHWETLADEVIPSTVSKTYSDLGAYHTLRMVLHMVPLTVDQWPHMRLGGGGALVTTGYLGRLAYSVEGAATIVGTGTIPNTTTMPLSWANPVFSQVTNIYGFQGEFTITQFNRSVQSLCIGKATWYTTGGILHADLAFRMSGAVPHDFLTITMFGGATAFSLRMLLEGMRTPPS